MTIELISNKRKTSGNYTFLRNTFNVGDNREYQLIEDVICEGNKDFIEFFDDYKEVSTNYTVTANDSSSDLPEISYNKNKNCFTICCYSHGNMTPNEFEKFLKDQQKGLEVASFLTRSFCANPTEEEEDDYETC